MSAAWVISFLLVSQTPAPLLLGELLDEVERGAPDVRVQSEALNVARARVGVAGAWEDPVLKVMVDDVRVSNGMNAQDMKPMATYQFEQPLSALWGRRGLAKDAARALTDSERARLRRTAWDAKAQAVQFFYALWMNRETRKLLEEQIGTLERMREASNARYKAGTMMAHHDFLRSEAEIAAMRAELAAVDAEREGIAAMIDALRGRPRDEALGDPALPPRGRVPPLSAVLSLAGQRPELEAARSMRTEAQAREGLARSMYYPMVMVGGGYQQRFSRDPDSVLGMMSVSVPIFWWDRQNNELAMTRAMVSQSEREIEAVQIMTEADIRMAWSQAWGVDRSVAAFEESAIPKTRETVRSGEAEYESGRGDYLRLLEAVTALLDVEKRRLELIVQREMSRFELERLVGSPLEDSSQP